LKWFRKKKEEPPLALSSARYKGRPVLILLENYVLDCIGALPPDKEASIRQIVKGVYGGDDNWQQTLQTVFGLEDGIDDGIRQLWAKNQDIATQGGTVLTPEEFARMIADANFAPYIDAIE
jgi:hypothetical protein